MEPMDNGAQKTNGAMVGVVIIILILIIGGIYLGKTKLDERRANEMLLEQQRQEQAAAEAANNLKESDEVMDIEADLQNNSNIDSLDLELQ